MKKQFHHLQMITLYVFCMLPVLVWGQLEYKPFLDNFRGTASVTHNGISLVPSFSLGEPAAIFDVKMTMENSVLNPICDLHWKVNHGPFYFGFDTRQFKKNVLRCGSGRILH